MAVHIGSSPSSSCWQHLNCHPDRSEPGFPTTHRRPTATCAAFFAESRMNFVDPTKLYRKSWVAKWRDLRFRLLRASPPSIVDYLQPASVDSQSMGKPSDLVQGTLDLLILKTISLEPKHGWAIAKRIQQISNEVLQVQQGSLYPALHRLEQQGWIRAKWGESGSGRQAKFYSLTAAGRAQLEREKESWNRLSSAINLVVEGI
jgi:PadR family transcriptional regulator PadR